jgi:hypothetical protein
MLHDDRKNESAAKICFEPVILTGHRFAVSRVNGAFVQERFSLLTFEKLVFDALFCIINLVSGSTIPRVAIPQIAASFSGRRG